VDIEKNGEKIRGIINDISIGGLGIYTDSIGSLQKDEEVLIKFELNGKTIEAKGIIRYTIEDLKKAGIEFKLNNDLESDLAEYVLERQFEIIKELRI